MTVNFKNIPQNLRVPLFYAELDNSMANSAQVVQRALIIGQILESGTATPNVPVMSQGVGDAQTAGGAGSMIHLMTQAYRNIDTFGEVWYLPLSDAAESTAATGTISVTTPPTAQGTISLYIGGVVVETPVMPTQTAAQIATALQGAIAATPNLPVSAAVANTTVTLTAINAGPCGNDIDLRLNYYGTSSGEVTPAGLTIAIAAMAGGAVAPTLTTALANLGDQTFDFIACPYNDTTSLNAIQALLNDVSGRWSWDQQIYGQAFAANRGTVAAQTTLGEARNDQHTSIMGFYDSPTPNWLWAAAEAAATAVSVRADPAAPLHQLALIGVLAPPLESRFDLTERNTLLYDGISTFTVGDDGTVYVERMITTYQTNAYGQADDSYLKVETMYNLMYVIRALQTLVTSVYGAVKLAANGTRFGPGANAVTPNIIRGSLIAKYTELETGAFVQDSAGFAAALIVEQNAQNPNRVDVLYPATLINQLDIFALLMQFRLNPAATAATTTS